MRSRGFKHRGHLLPECTGAEEEDHDEGVGEADFGAVDEAVAETFDDGEDVMVLGVEDEPVYGFLGGGS